MRRYLLFFFTLTTIGLAGLTLAPVTASAADPNDPAESSAYDCEVDSAFDNRCQALKADSSNPCTTDVTKCGTIYYVNGIVNLFAVLFGVGVVISIIIGGIQYSTSAGDPQRASAAKTRIRNAIIALVGFMFLYAALNFTVLGGV